MRVFGCLLALLVTATARADDPGDIVSGWTKSLDESHVGVSITIKPPQLLAPMRCEIDAFERLAPHRLDMDDAPLRVVTAKPQSICRADVEIFGAELLRQRRLSLQRRTEPLECMKISVDIDRQAIDLDVIQDRGDVA